MEAAENEVRIVVLVLQANFILGVRALKNLPPGSQKRQLLAVVVTMAKPEAKAKAKAIPMNCTKSMMTTHKLLLYLRTILFGRIHPCQKTSLSMEVPKAYRLTTTATPL